MKRLIGMAVLLLAAAGCHHGTARADPCVGPRGQAAAVKAVNTLTWAGIVHHDPQCFTADDLNLAGVVSP